MTWSKEELHQIAEADDLHISPFREDGETYGTPTWIWSVVVDGNLYVRAYSGKESRWYQAAMRQKAGRVASAGLTKEVRFEPVEGTINDRIDDGYREKYRRSPYLNPMIGPSPCRHRSDCAKRIALRDISRIMKPAFLLLISAMLIAHTASGAEDAAAGHSTKPLPSMKVRIKAGEKTITATMRDTETARDFLSLLPLQLNLKDYAGTEKISDLPKRLSTQGAPRGHDPDVGDITYYAPWGNLAIFYKDFGYSDGLIKLGKIDGDIAVLTTSDAPKVTIELIQ